MCPVATEGRVDCVSITDGTRGVELYSSTDSFLVSEAIVRSAELHARIDREVIVEETGIEADVTAEAIHLVGLQYTLLVVEARRHAVGELASSTADTDVVVTTVGELIDLVLPVGISRAELRGRSGGDTLDERAVFVSREHAHTASSFGEGALYGDSDLGLLPDLTTLGGDHDDPVRGARTVDSGSRSVLEDVHRSDVLRVERAEDAGRTRYGGILDGHTVDDDKRVVAGIERSTTADTDTATSPRRALGRDLYPRDLTDEEVAGRGDSALLEVLRIEGADGSGEVLLLHGAVADDDDLLEVLSTLGEDDLQRERSATEGYGLRGIADARDDEVPILGGTDGEVPVDIGDDALRGLLDLDGSPDDGFALVVYYLTLDLHVLCGGCEGEEE